MASGFAVPVEFEEAEKDLPGKEKLDEGPIIEQTVEKIDHNFDIDELIQIGKDAECAAFVRAVKWHCEHRIIVNGLNTVVFKALIAGAWFL
ncbi:MAG: hypothetical protein CMQ17_01460 [Gammaproteobacteria bacterium]|jgi:hypothetical protein|nr:hypothetical protein [Gammaproteobacteria bacterium]|tara:strand:- start:5528 stop:5800 length:273 start_codon:yes stop_codon:yes gene_type:complete